tara:strand:+ start:641 stop:985 length:345 start_codon:yes stop_codon:yes gene_type:complete
VPARPGAFNANFAPETLESFKAVCRDRGEKYTKILEQFAQLYVQTNGEVLKQLSVGSSGASTSPAGASSPITTRGTYAEMLERLESVESNGREFVSAFEMLLHRVESLEEKVNI